MKTKYLPDSQKTEKQRVATQARQERVQESNTAYSERKAEKHQQGEDERRKTNNKRK